MHVRVTDRSHPSERADRVLDATLEGVLRGSRNGAKSCCHTERYIPSRALALSFRTRREK